MSTQAADVYVVLRASAATAAGSSKKSSGGLSSSLLIVLFAVAVAFLGGGATMSYADICLFDCVEGIEDCGYFDAGDRAKYPLLTALYDHVGAAPAIAAYLAKRGSRFVAAA